MDKDLEVQNWINNYLLRPDYVLFQFLQETKGSCAVIPISDVAEYKTFIDGSIIELPQRQYDFAIQIMAALSQTTDNINTQNMYTLRQWQEWIREQEREKIYPNFGENCSNYHVINVSDAPQMAQVYEGNMAKYQFFARILYEEDN